MKIARSAICYLIITATMGAAGTLSAKGANLSEPQTGPNQKTGFSEESSKNNAAESKVPLPDKLPDSSATKSPPAPEASIEQIPAEDTSPAGIGKGIFKRLMNKAYFWRLRYYFVAQNAANCTLFYGLIQDDPFLGRATVEFIFPNGCNCHGYAQVTHLPKGRSVVGQEGIIRTKCTDGQKMTGRFVTTSLTTGTAVVTDSRGNNYQATFGHTSDQAVSSVNALRRKLGCPECNARDIELKVEGKVLHAK